MFPTPACNPKSISNFLGSLRGGKPGMMARLPCNAALTTTTTKTPSPPHAPYCCRFAEPLPVGLAMAGVDGVGGGRAGQPAVSTDQLVVAAVAMLHPAAGAIAS